MGHVMPSRVTPSLRQRLLEVIAASDSPRRVFLKKYPGLFTAMAIFWQPDGTFLYRPSSQKLKAVYMLLSLFCSHNNPVRLARLRGSDWPKVTKQLHG